MNKCDTCKANKVCDHNKFGWENCGSYIPINVAREIFQEIEKVIGEKYENYVFDNLKIEGLAQDAIIDFADTMKRHFVELKKKYTQ